MKRHCLALRVKSASEKSFDIFDTSKDQVGQGGNEIFLVVLPISV
jgi:hypothetical protein